MTVRMSAPDFWNDGNAARALIDKKNALEATTEPYAQLLAQQDELEVMAQLLQEAGTTEAEHPDVQALAEEVEALEKNFARVELQALMVGPFDANNAILTLYAWAGVFLITVAVLGLNILARVLTRNKN